MRHWLRSKNKEVPGVKEKPSQAKEMKGSSFSLAKRWWPVWAGERVSGAAERSKNGASSKSLQLGSNPAAGIHWVRPN